MAKQTFGPWKSLELSWGWGGYAVDSDERNIATVNAYKISKADQARIACLIAATPTLLGALKWIARKAEVELSLANSRSQRAKWLAIKEAAQAAIAEATVERQRRNGELVSPSAGLRC